MNTHAMTDGDNARFHELCDEYKTEILEFLQERGECPACYGEGVVERDIPGGRYDSAQMQYYPETRVEPCPVCKY